MPDTACADAGGFEVERRWAGIDWITMIGETRNQRDELLTVADAIQATDTLGGDVRRPWSFQGFKGWQTSRVRAGTNSNRVVIQSSGEAADTLSGLLTEASGRPTRLDVQTTHWLSSTRTDAGWRSVSVSLSESRLNSPSTRTGGAFLATDGSCLITAGRRTSERYGRVYDKGVEQRSAPPGRVWRVEVETKGGLAQRLWTDYQRAKDRRTWCFASCESQWKLLEQPWPWPESSDPTCPVVAPKRKPAPAHSLMAWLRVTVAPTIPRILTAYTVDEVIEALGLREPDDA